MNIQNAIELITSITGRNAANFSELKKLYKSAALLCHPDRTNANETSVSMKELNKAWDFLGNKEAQVNSALHRTSNGATPVETSKNDPLLDHELYDSPLPTFESRETLLRQAFNIVDEKDWNSWVESKFKTVYFSQYSIRLHTFAHCMRITHLTNALEARKSCTEYNITWDSHNDHEGYCKLLDWISEESENSCVSVLLAHLTILNFTEDRHEVEKAELCPGIKVSRYKLKSGRVFSPFKLHKIKPLPSMPEKIRANHLIKAIANGQYRQLVQKTYLTDDYSWDHANNNGRKVFENPFPLLVKLIEDRSGCFYLFPRHEGLFTFGDHMNDTKSIVVNIENRFPAVDLINSNLRSKLLQ